MIITCWTKGSLSLPLGAGVFLRCSRLCIQTHIFGLNKIWFQPEDVYQYNYDMNRTQFVINRLIVSVRSVCAMGASVRERAIECELCGFMFPDQAN